MPILTVEVVERDDENLPADVAQRLVDAAGAVLEAPEGEAWVFLRRVAARDYAQYGGDTDAPVIVRVVRYELPDVAELREEARQLARAVATACGRPVEQVHIVYEPDGRGRVAFGGERVE